jgi:zinc transport system ATP-binding protein
MVTHDWESAFHHSDYVLMLDSRQICFEKPDIAFCDEFIRTAFGHVGHNHTIKFGGKQ